VSEPATIESAKVDVRAIAERPRRLVERELLRKAMAVFYHMFEAHLKYLFQTCCTIIRRFSPELTRTSPHLKPRNRTKRP
jgi:hypothetical protein